MKKVLSGLALTSLLLSLSIGGYWMVRQSLQQAKTLINDQVNSIARLKVEQITAWRKEKLAGAELLKVNHTLVTDLLRWLANGTAPRERGVTKTYLDALIRQYGYEGFLLIDAEGTVRYSSLGSGQVTLDDEGQAALAEAWRTRGAMMSDLHAGADHPYPHLGIIAPLFQGSAPAGAVLLLVNARQTLYPLIQSWPIASMSGESLLIRRDGDAILFLNDPRHKENAALNLRIPLSRSEVPAVQAMLGKSGLLEGPDYRGIPVLAIGLPVPETGWFLIAKIDTREALAPARREALIQVGGLSVILGLLVILAILAWLGRRRAHARALHMAETAKIESLLRFQNLFEQSLDGILLMLGQGHRFLDANPASLRLLGYTRDELLGLRLPDILAAQEHQRLDREVALTLGGVPHHQEWLITRKDGSTFIGEATAKALDSERYFAVFRDITERKRIERTLQETTERLETMLTALPDLMFRVNREGVILDFRTAAIELLYVHPDKFLGRKVVEVLPPEAAATLMAALEEAATQGSHRGAVYALPMPQGETWYEASVARIAGTDPVNPELIILARDITERRALERQLRKLSLAVEQSVESIAITDLEARLEYVNEAFIRNTGYQREEVMGQNPRVLQSGKTPRATYGALWAALLAGHSWQGEFINRRKDGSEFVEWASLSPLREPNGNITGYVGVKLDITDRKRAEAALIEAREVAEAASQAKTRFLAHMSHELRTPMNAILGFAQLLQQDQLTEDQRQMVDLIREAGDNLLRIINDVLDLSKIEAGRMTLESRPFTLAPLLERLGRLLRLSAADRGLDLILDPPPATPDDLQGDAPRLEQVLINLLGNAIKFTDTGQVRLHIMPLEVTPETATLRFEITDTGIGIEPDTLAQLFQPFSQGDSSLSRRHGGTGLGLVISQRLVEQMGGKLGVTSTPGRGSRFWFELTFPRIVNPRLSEAPPSREPPPTALPPLDGLRLLAVDDNLINLRMIERVLQRQGATVTLAHEGREALQQLQAQPDGFDAVLMDIQMPVMDGLTATREIRQNPALRHLPVVALTAGVLPDEREAALAAGVDDFLAKPLQLSQMTAVLNRLLPVGRLGEPG